MSQNISMRKIALLIIFLSFGLFLRAGVSVKFIIGGGMWSLNPLKGQIEGLADDQIDEAIRSTIEKDYPELEGAEYSHSTNFSSSGGIYGMGFRLYPGGKNGSFSFGLFLRKINMNLKADGKVNVNKEGNNLKLNGTGKVNISTPVLLAELRWEFLPSRILSPYFTFGGGAGYLKGSAEFKGSGTSEILGKVKDYSINESKTFDELRKEEEAVPSFLPFVKLSLGLRIRMLEKLSSSIEFGVLDGFALSGGLSYRF